ncbi:hypothetical protein HY345_01405 [Candidatus Microgenomates bacterium]|nr:hypothetical protein [Candidatus Microgenomates bacterium]
MSSRLERDKQIDPNFTQENRPFDPQQLMLIIKADKKRKRSSPGNNEKSIIEQLDALRRNGQGH